MILVGHKNNKDNILLRSIWLLAQTQHVISIIVLVLGQMLLHDFLV